MVGNWEINAFVNDAMDISDDAFGIRFTYPFLVQTEKFLELENLDMDETAGIQVATELVPEDGETGPLTNRIFYLGKNKIVVGRGLADMKVNHHSISRMHSELFEISVENAKVRDLNSSNGTFINGQPVTEGKEVQIRDGDVISFGSITFKFVSPSTIRKIVKNIAKTSGHLPTTEGTEEGAQLLIHEGPDKGGVIEVKPRMVCQIGTAEDCSTVLTDPSVSPKHFSLVFDASKGLLIQDSASAAGTRVNGETVLLQSTLNVGDTILVGGTQIVVKLISGTIDPPPESEVTTLEPASDTPLCSLDAPTSSDAELPEGIDHMETGSATMERFDTFAKIASEMEMDEFIGKYPNPFLLLDAYQVTSDEDTGKDTGSQTFWDPQAGQVADVGSQGSRTTIRPKASSGVIPLVPDEENRVTIGRTRESHIFLSNDRISKDHCRVIRNNSGWALEDLGSTNGTFLNGERLLPKTGKLINDGDGIVFGGAYIASFFNNEGFYFYLKMVTQMENRLRDGS